MAQLSGHKKKNVEKDPSFRKKKPLGYFPIQRQVRLGAPTGIAQTTGTFDAGRLLSQVNHRLYRYGKKYNMKIDVDVDVLTPGQSIEVFALIDTWYVQKAFEEAHTVFQRAYIDERENISKSARARWRDFRVNDGIGSLPLFAQTDSNPLTTAGALIVAGEFDESIVEDSAGVTRAFTWSGATTATEYSIVAEYNLASNTTVSPGTTTGAGPYDDLEADASAVEMEALQARGNAPPYDATTFPSVWVKVATLAVDASGAQKLSTGFFDAPCGLIHMNALGGADFQDVNSLRNNVAVTFAKGDYKGVSAHSMERV